MKEPSKTLHQRPAKVILFRLMLIALPMAAAAVAGLFAGYMADKPPWQSMAMAFTGGAVALAAFFALIDLFWD